MDVIEINNLIVEKMQESLYLEFKNSKAITRQNDAKKELVKDVTGFANADGGRIVYGIGETKENGIVTAGALAPLTSEDINKDWVAAVIRDNTSPRFHNFDIHEVLVEGGRVLIVDVRAGGTAYQNLLDHRYYQRSGAATVPITDFQIRDLMARSAKPQTEVSLKIIRLLQNNEFHRYIFGISIRNTGTVTMEKWWLELDVPTQVLTDTRLRYADRMREHPLFERMVRNTETSSGKRICRISLGDHFFDGTRYILHPQQTLDFVAPPMNIPQLIVEIDQDRYRQVLDMPMRWTLYLNNSAPVVGEIPFADWCNY